MILPFCLFCSGMHKIRIRDYEYTAIPGYIPEKVFLSDDGAVNMGKYNDSFNFQFWAKDTVTGKQIDLIDNDYFEISAFRVNETTKKAQFRDPAIQFVHCPEHLAARMKSGSKKKGACFGGRDSINMKANWQ